MDTAPDNMLDDINAACKATGYGTSATIHTLATVLADEGQVEESQRRLAQAAALRADSQVQALDLLVLGMNLETLGYTKEAENTYADIVGAEDRDLEASGNDVYRLAELHLKRLRSEPTSSAASVPDTAVQETTVSAAAN